MVDSILVRCAKALRTARRLLKDEHDAIIASACPHEDGKPIIGRLDPSYRALDRRYRRVLKKIDEALGEH